MTVRMTSWLCSMFLIMSTGFSVQAREEGYIPQPDLPPAKSSPHQEKSPRLFLAVKQGNRQAVQKYIRLGDDVNLMGINGDTPLLLAIEKGHTQIIKALIHSGALLNIPNNKGITPLTKAVETNDLLAVKQLLQAGAQINLMSASGMKASFKAIETANEDLFFYLLQNGANLNTSTYGSFGPQEYVNPVELALKTPNRKILKYLLGQKSIPDTLSHNILISKKLLDQIDAEILSRLLKKGFKTRGGVLEYAVEQKYSQMIPLLTREYLSRYSSSLTLMHFVRNKNVLREMMKVEAFKNHVKTHKNPLVIEAVKRGDLALLKFLFEQGASLNAEEEYGDTPLFLAVSQKHFEITRYLLDQRQFFFLPAIDLNYQNRLGLTVSDIKTSKEIKLLLEKHGAKLP